MTDTSTIQDIVYALAASPDFARDGVCFAARGSGLYRSDDGGATWQLAYKSLNLAEPLVTMAVAVSPDFSADQTVFAGVPGGVLRSEDEGQNWHVVEFPAPPPVVSSLAISPNYADDGLVLAGTLEDGVYLSANRGRQWVAWNFGLFDPHVLCIALSPNLNYDRTVFAGTETGLFRSRNGGRSWQDIPLPVEDAVLSLALSPGYADDNVMLVGTETYGLFSSQDEGRTWQQIGKDFVTGAVNDIIVAVDNASTRRVLILLSDNLLISDDEGSSWFEVQKNLDMTEGATSLAAPQGLASNTLLLVGLVKNGVARVELASGSELRCT